MTAMAVTSPASAVRQGPDLFAAATTNVRPPGGEPALVESTGLTPLVDAARLTPLGR